jgi:hypothetical protein
VCLCLWLHFFCLTVLADYGASFASDFNHARSEFCGKKGCITASGYTDSTSLKTSHPHGLPREEKSMGLRKLNVCP